MSERARRTGRPVDPERVGPERVGNVGPVDPHADPVTDPSMRPVPATPDAGSAPTVPTRREPAPEPAPEPAVARTRSSGLWVGMVLSSVVLLFLLVFILQNSEPVRIRFLNLEGTLPTGVALLLAAIAGVLLVAIPGSLRIL
ncbi:MAG TPA: LapA family protein, partial [Pseudonocardia sp.]|nr:LapA family protein [Pseudonocardia sp.]